jgi:hypothetical protein
VKCALHIASLSTVQICRTCSRNKRLRKHFQNISSLGLLGQQGASSRPAQHLGLNVNDMNDTVLIALTQRSNLCIERRSAISERVKQIILDETEQYFLPYPQVALSSIDRMKLVDDILNLNGFEIYPLSLNEEERYIRRLMIRVNDGERLRICVVNISRTNC